MLDHFQQRFNVLNTLALLTRPALAACPLLIVADHAHVTSRQPDIARFWITGDGVWFRGNPDSRVLVIADASIMPFQVMFTGVLANTTMKKVERLVLLACRLLGD